MTNDEERILAMSQVGDIVPIGDQLIRVNLIDEITNRIGGFVLDCEWFARCGKDATHLTPHSILGYVPTCAKCNRFAIGVRSDRPEDK